MNRELWRGALWSFIAPVGSHSAKWRRPWDPTPTTDRIGKMRQVDATVHQSRLNVQRNGINHSVIPVVNLIGNSNPLLQILKCCLLACQHPKRCSVGNALARSQQHKCKFAVFNTTLLFYRTTAINSHCTCVLSECKLETYLFALFKNNLCSKLALQANLASLVVVGQKQENAVLCKRLHVLP